MRLTQIVEALLFASDAPLTAADIARVDDRLDEDTVEAIVQQLREEYDMQERAWQVYEIAGGYQLLTRPDYAPYLEAYSTVPQQTRLSNPALEVLAVISYRQPIGRNEIEEIRGVSSSGVLKTLQDRNLIDVVGRSEGLGRPLLYGTTPKFLEHFGFNSLDDLPRPDELPVILRERPVISEAPADAEQVEDTETALATTAQPESVESVRATHEAPAEVMSEAEAHDADEAVAAAAAEVEEAHIGEPVEEPS